MRFATDYTERLAQQVIDSPLQRSQPDSGAVVRSSVDDQLHEAALPQRPVRSAEPKVE
ncbi:hypothetical protein [Pseudomonas amygdali]|uniref:hypothetical protein n=1 Tax=Pseudomonas amygdali TaxID=47877 RepID=UPI000AA722F6|nr:hypothetical protein [Pseudomonas amygdali]